MVHLISPNCVQRILIEAELGAQRWHLRQLRRLEDSAWEAQRGKKPPEAVIRVFRVTQSGLANHPRPMVFRVRNANSQRTKKIDT